MISRALLEGAEVIVPGSALAQAIRDPARQARLAHVLRHPKTKVVALDRADATLVGRLLALSRTNDIADAHVVVCARRASHHVVTSDPGDIAKLDPRVSVIVV
jgi:hypothetical protein